MSDEEKEYFDDLKERIKKSRYVFYADFSELEFLINIIEKQQKEIEEKTTIIMAGAEKVKQLEKEIEDLKKENNEIWGHLPRLD